MYNAAELNDLIQTTARNMSFQVAVPVLEQPGPAYLYLSGNELCTEATMHMPTERPVRATSGTCVVGSPSLD